MTEYTYRIEGEVQIPEELRTPVNKVVLTLLEVCGIRNTTEIFLCGKKVPVLAPPCPDGEGLVKFNCSIFTDETQPLCVYDTTTCRLQGPDWGPVPYQYVLCLILAVEAAFSPETCRFISPYGRDDLSVWKTEAFNLLPGKKGRACSERAAHCLRRIFKRENEDEFLDYWGRGTLDLSPALQENLKNCVDEFHTCTPVEPEEVESVLCDILTDMVRGWNCHPGDLAFAREFLTHREDPAYRKALAMVRSFLYRHLEYFPELTRGQALDWMIRRYHTNHERIAIQALLSLLVNHRKRKELLGF